MEVEFFGAGETVFRQGEGPLQHVWVVRRGQIELTDEDRVLDVLGEGELFGHRWTLAGLPIGIEARAAEDTLLYRLPADRVMTALARPAGLRYLAETMHGRSAPGVSTGVALDPVHQPVAQLVNGSPIIGDPDWTVRETGAAHGRRRRQRRARPRLRPGARHRHRQRPSRPGRGGRGGADAPVTEVMSSPAFTVTPERYGADVMLEMLDRTSVTSPSSGPTARSSASSVTAICSSPKAGRRSSSVARSRRPPAPRSCDEPRRSCDRRSSASITRESRLPRSHRSSPSSSMRSRGD